MDALSFVVAMLGSVGLVLMATSLPPLAGRGLTRRVEPYLHGLRGKPSALLPRSALERKSWLARWLGRLGFLGRRGLAARLEAAGQPSDEVAFALEQIVWAGAGAGITIGALGLGSAAGVISPSPALAAVALIAAITGGLARDWYLSKEIAHRRAILINDLPTAIDHMALALLAGESVAGSFVRVATSACGPVADEFERVAADIRGGEGVVESLDAFRTRIADPAIARFVDSMCTAIERGTSLADVLRTQADDIREDHRRRLLEMGGRREIAMLVPVVFLIMPVVVLFALYPGLVSLELLVP